MYLIAFVAQVTGIVLTLIMQWTGAGGLVQDAGIVLFCLGILGITGLALGLRHRVGTAGRFAARNATGYERAWQRLALGLEVRGAWSAVMG
jgi:hypothetical protein